MSNMRAAALMVLSMTLFAVEDMFLKLLARDVPVGQVLAMVGGVGMLVFWALTALRGQQLKWRDLRHPLVLIRSLGEAICGLAFVTAIVIGDLSSASAILQALPLTMTLGAALFLGEAVGWRRWTSIIVGFIGVLLIVQPGTTTFQPASLLAVIAVMALTMRDLVTRRVPPQISSETLTVAAFGAIMLAGTGLALLRGDAVVMLRSLNLIYLLFTTVVGLAAYSTLVAAVRLAPISVVAPFRYSRIIVAMVIGIAVFGERPDTLVWIGAGVIVVSGIYAMWRETRAARRRVMPPLV